MHDDQSLCDTFTEKCPPHNFYYLSSDVSFIMENAATRSCKHLRDHLTQFYGAESISPGDTTISKGCLLNLAHQHRKSNQFDFAATCKDLSHILGYEVDNAAFIQTIRKITCELVRAEHCLQDNGVISKFLLKEDVDVKRKDLQELPDPEQSFIETLKSETAADIEGDECQGMKLLYDYCF